MVPDAWDVWGPTHLNSIKKRIYDDISKVLELEKLDPTVDDDKRLSRTSFLGKIIN